MIALAYLAVLTACLVILAAVLLRPRRTPAPPTTPPPAAAAAGAFPAAVGEVAPELHVILTAATALAARLGRAA